MPRDYLPPREAELVAWSTNFNTRIGAAPTDFGLTAAQATEYATLHTAFVNAYNLVTGSDNSTPKILAKNDAKRALIAKARALVGIIQKWPEMTNEKRGELLITVPDNQPTPRPIPVFAPSTSVLSVTGHTVKIRLRDVENPDRRGKPDNVAGAAIWSYVGETPPASIKQWAAEGNITRTIVDVAIDPDVAPGAKVWLIAQWFNARQQSGPASDPISVTIGGGVSVAA